ncbi:class I SAM-dependent methyltransferase [Candidatus Methanocrinis natronophilus]|uniref:Class I SAM-dependent methyltransferase n=1 Tax=Candidatus Methanocrinis natronophilus TaxID=3033396 RepID=A0ABT5X8D1_9EURY|nr:class I SAM-dependent methyltransferase [Candidatus Methanocrinis natronophilus]MDF0590959.1 class I SAM-dependent methyltransferase [Candidatus Methanocrinis natronophilus]
MRGSTPYEDQVDRYDRWFERNRAAYLSELAAVRSLTPPFRLGLEVGVGTGRFAAPLGVSVGLDPSLPMMEVARERGVLCVRGVAERLPFRDGAFDLLLMVTVDFLLRERAVAFQEAERVLAAGGSIVVGFIDGDSPLSRRYEAEKGRDGGGEDDRGGFYGDARFLSSEEMASLLKGAGFGDLAFAETLFSEPEDMIYLEPPIPGCGRGSFVVVRAERL